MVKRYRLIKNFNRKCEADVHVNVNGDDRGDYALCAGELKNHWLFEINETDQGDCLTAFGFFFRNEQLFFYIEIALL